MEKPYIIVYFNGDEDHLKFSFEDEDSLKAFLTGFYEERAFQRHGYRIQSYILNPAMIQYIHVSIYNR